MNYARNRYGILPFTYDKVRIRCNIIKSKIFKNPVSSMVTGCVESLSKLEHKLGKPMLYH
ncbi:MAG: hypothetical protein WCS30_00290 [Selenomonadaceae bacterium]